ncbi:MAG: hypothetical protein KIT57_16820 [Blastocatellales bacterium]|nr:hypothetical protein [Blastocatellales bacterium]
MTFSGGENIAPGANTQVTFNPVVVAGRIHYAPMEGGLPIKMSAKPSTITTELLEEKVTTGSIPCWYRAMRRTCRRACSAAVLPANHDGAVFTTRLRLQTGTSTPSGHWLLDRAIDTQRCGTEHNGASQMRYSL